MASEENIRVAVRLRPLLQNLKNEANGKVKRVVHMDELSSSVSLTNPDNPVDIHKFAFDNILWSYDGFSEQVDGYLAPDNKVVSEELYCDQKQVYEEVGKEMIQNLWNGQNAALYTFGESKSGKSWTLLGLGVNKGIVPLACTDLFKGVREKEKTLQQSGSALEVRLCMAEMYNEKVKDLLPASSSVASTKLKNFLKIREHSKKGFYIEGLRSVLVVNNEDIQQRLEEGLLNRAVFLTNCNATSDNSMTMITVTLVQKIRNARGDEVTRSATMEFFDLPACEFNENVQPRNYVVEDEDLDYNATPGYSHIRRNGVHCLTNCVDLLLEASIENHSDPIPFHRHAVTKLLRNSLNGNSKTYLLVALSPSHLSYENSMQILRFAEKVRMLMTRSITNEEVTTKLIRELKGDNEKLKKLISLGEVEINDYFSHRFQPMNHLNSSERDGFKRRVLEDMKAQIRENEKDIRNFQLPFEERLKPFKTEKNDLSKKIENDKKNKCHIFNINGDSQITGKITHILPLGTVDFGYVHNNGGKAKDNNHFISFCGPGIREHHGTFSYNSKDGKISIKPAGPNCKVFVNETSILFDTVLAHNDRILLGSNQLWIYQNPKETWLEKYAYTYKLHYEYVMEELAVKSEHYQNFNNESLTENLQEELVQLIPALEDAKSMTEDLNQNYTFQPLVLQPIDVLLRDNNNGVGSSNESKASYTVDKGECDDESGNTSAILVKVQNTVDGTFSYWSSGKFFDRLETIKESYMQFLEDGDAPLKEIEAFKEGSDLDVPIGYSVISLKPLAYLINIENSSVPILDYVSFHTIGKVNVSVHFCDENGEKMNDTEVFIETPDELLDDNFTVVMNIGELQSVTLQFKDIYCKYRFLEQNQDTTKYLDSKVSTFMGISSKHSKKYLIEPVTDNALNLILTQYLVLRFFGKQRAHKLLNLAGGLSILNKPHDRGSRNPLEMENTMAELKIKEKAEQRHKGRLNALKELISQSETLGEDAISVEVVKSIFEAKSKKFVDQSLEDHKELLTALPEEPEPKQLPPELKALKRFSEVCTIV